MNKHKVRGRKERARPIETTPPLKGKDAEVLRASLKQHATDDVIARRQEGAVRFLARVMGTKPARANTTEERVEDRVDSKPETIFVDLNRAERIFGGRK